MVLSIFGCEKMVKQTMCQISAYRGKPRVLWHFFWIGYAEVRTELRTLDKERANQCAPPRNSVRTYLHKRLCSAGLYPPLLRL